MVHNEIKGDLKSYMADKIKPVESKNGRVKLDTVIVEDRSIRMLRLQDMLNRQSEYWGVKAGDKITRLIVDGSVMMSDTPMEIRTNREFICLANGHVLIAGLGMGTIVHIIQDFDTVKSITVIEYDKDVLEVVMPQMKFNSKVKVIHDDIYTWKPEMKYDVIWFDIWPTICSDNWEDMKKLNKKFKYKLNRTNVNCWMRSWRQEECQKAYYADKAEMRFYQAIRGY